jgi:hypothetical protein
MEKSCQSHSLVTISTGKWLPVQIDVVAKVKIITLAGNETLVIQPIASHFVD